MLLHTGSLLNSPNAYRTAMHQPSFDTGMGFALTALTVLAKENNVGIMRAACILSDPH